MGVPRTYLTMFEVIFGGVSWDEVVSPLNEEVSILMPVIFCIYVAFCQLAMMNMATGVSVNTAMQRAQEETDAFMVNRIRDFFFNDAFATEDELSIENFSAALESPILQD